jgi:hypothetical protein
MTVIFDLLGSIDLLQIVIRVFIFYRTLWCLTSFFFFFVRTNQKNVDTAEIFLVNLSPTNSENQQPSNATIQQIIHRPISHFL